MNLLLPPKAAASPRQGETFDRPKLSHDLQESENITKSVQRSLVKLLDQQIRDGGITTLHLAPVMELTGIFGCSAKVILETLVSLRHRGYACIILGMDCPILIQEVKRNRPQRRRPSLRFRCKATPLF